MAEQYQQPVEPASDEEPKKERRWRKRALVGAGLLVAFLIGTSAGGSGPEATETPEYQAVVADLDEAEASLVEVTQERDAALEDATAAAEQVATMEASLADREANVESRSQELDAREQALNAHQAEVDAAAAAVAEREAAVTEAEAAPPPAPAPAPAPAPEPERAAYYENCTAARNAGAAPVRRGDPGYGTHLDRDGDGVGCE
ncbi:excalibur calcium-binding domain-containing protein [Georgenia sp. MJ206]|uniref:excalibur calcium-binding domain-containing protein n=1 Tax=Georgenia wangjunii TaxID=3117730 RepID=UPI002F269239